MKIRIAAPLPGVYQDFRAAAGDAGQADAARAAGVDVLFTSQNGAAMRGGVLVMKAPAELPAPAHPGAARAKHLNSAFKQFPEEVFALAGGALGSRPELQFRSFSTHVLARELTAEAIGASLAEGRFYKASDWLCDPAGFYFIAETKAGVYDIGDPAPLGADTRLLVNLPIPAKIALERSGSVVAEAAARRLSYLVKEPGDYRMRAWLTIDGETFEWLNTMPIHVETRAPAAVPVERIPDEVEIRRGLAYAAGDGDRQKLDLYLPKGKRSFPVMVFLHGGAWRSGDRSQYTPLGARFAAAGIGVAIPDFRLMPKDPYPAQPEDAATAFRWVQRHIGEYGGDPARIYLAGHSSGGHLASLVALDPKYGLERGAICGVISISGLYNVGSLAEFQNADDDPSPIDHVHRGAPPFLLTYCEWDEFGLPEQARRFAAALREKFVPARLVYVERENHLSEIRDIAKPGDATARAILDFIQ
ncbi:MAG TPA: alpha/beta hydrolase [Bryobacteraceae bacterium]|nr:alpha/beta hydrolase [Bryobacteraceae bacterium]